MILLNVQITGDFISTVKSDRLLGNRKVSSCKLLVGVVPDCPFAGRNYNSVLRICNLSAT